MIYNSQGSPAVWEVASLDWRVLDTRGAPVESYPSVSAPSRLKARLAKTRNPAARIRTKVMAVASARAAPSMGNEPSQVGQKAIGRHKRWPLTFGRDLKQSVG